MSIFLLVFGFFILLGILILFKHFYLKKICTELSIGQVVDIITSHNTDSDGNTHTTLYPVFEYTVDGETYTKKSSYGSNTCKFDLGESVDIYYNPKNPKQYFVPNDNTSLALGIIFIVVPLIFLFGIYIIKQI